MRTLHLLLAALLAAALGTAPAAQTPLAVRGVPPDVPCTVTAHATDRTLTVGLDLAPGWHAYARDVGGGEPVRITVDDACGFTAAGDLRTDDDGHGRLVGRTVLSLPIAPRDGSRALRATLALQICDALECLDPLSLTLTGEVAPLAVLLVVAAVDPRSDRIAAWLQDRGFDVTVDTYADVTADACARHDVVIADSDVFRRHGVGLDVVHRFPKTDTPLVAVGFLGTELVEAHGLAMTSGYI